MSKQTEALKLALEALTHLQPTALTSFYTIGNRDKAVAAIREALAEPPAQHERVQPDSECKEDDGCPTEKAVLQRFWRKAQQQEPVAYASDVEFDDETEIIQAEHKGKLGTAGLRIALYIEPPASKPWVGLTQQDIDIAFDDTQEGGGFNEFAHAIEAKLREKNA